MNRIALSALLLLVFAEETQAQVIKKKPPLPTAGVTAGRGGVSPVRRRRRRCAPENRAACHGQEVSPIVLTNMLPELVLGQPDFTTESRSSTATAEKFGLAYRVGSDGTALFVVDMSFNRVMVWPTAPTRNLEPALRVIGQPNLTSYPVGSNAAGLNGPAAATMAGGKLVVVDSSNARVQVFTGMPAGDGASATLTLGQSGLSAVRPDAFNRPVDAWTDGARLVVLDGAANRILIWRTFPTRAGQIPDAVLGQGDLTSSAAGPGPNQLKYPSGIDSDGRDLYVADTGNHRVLVFKDFATKPSGAAADLVLGGPTGSATASTFNMPHEVLVHDGALFVADRGNRRILVWDVLPTAAGQPATHVLGQDVLTDGTLRVGVSPTSLNTPGGMVVTGDMLWVSDFGWNRVLGYRLYP